DVRKIVDLGEETANERRLHVLQQQTDARDGCDGLPQRDQVARTGSAERRARHQPFHVVDRLQRLAKLGALRGPEGELLDRAEPNSNVQSSADVTRAPRRSSSESARTSASAGGATISLGLRTDSSSDNACRASPPVNSAVVNSPVERSISATPNPAPGAGAMA